MSTYCRLESGPYTGCFKLAAYEGLNINLRTENHTIYRMNIEYYFMLHVESPRELYERYKSYGHIRIIIFFSYTIRGIYTVYAVQFSFSPDPFHVLYVLYILCI